MTALGRSAPLGAWSRADRRLRRLVLLVLGVVIVAGTVTVAVGSFRPGATSPPARLRTAAPHHTVGATASRGAAAAPPASPTKPMPPLGVYAGPGAAAAVEAVDGQLDGTVRYALDFLPESSWAAMTDPTWLQAAWAGSPFDLVIGVPMLPESGATMADGAEGDYDAEFSLLAGRLVAAGLGDAVLMVGWQPDDDGTPWYVRTAAAALDYVRYWDAIESTMAAVPGARFVFEWDAGDSDTSPVSPAQMYPGDAAVDVVATDAFDVVSANIAGGGQWPAVLERPYGPSWATSFASRHGKPLALAMWGVVPRTAGGGGDAADFVAQVLGWARSVGASMCVLWDYGSWAITGGDFPAAAARLDQVLGTAAGSGGGVGEAAAGP